MRLPESRDEDGIIGSMQSHETREKTGEAGGVRMGLLSLLRPRTSQVGALGLALLLLACSRPATGDLGYDPERDPAADLQALVETAQARGTRILVVSRRVAALPGR
jgi:hypothetical protein